MSLDKLLENVNVLAIVCNQWGDTGKGKFVDYFSQWADIIARGTGGANAGHTILINDKEYIFHLVPSGILFDYKGKINIIGSGVAFDPRIFLEELEILEKANKTYNNLMISKDAKLVLPQHILLDRIKERRTLDGKVEIGTTKRGIGPLYTDHYARVGLRVNDILNPDIFKKKLKKNLEDKLILLRGVNPAVIEEEMNHEHLLEGLFYDQRFFFNIDAIVEKYVKYGNELRRMISDTDTFLQDQVRLLKKNKILLEGAQGLLLSIDHGNYPFVTSSDPTIQGLAKGVGLNQDEVDLTLGIVKFYMTKVGEGPVPTEFGKEKSKDHCREKNREKEQKLYPNPSINSENEFERGVAIRFAGKEYGATTERPRRTARLDLPLLRYAARTNGNKIILTKVDVLSKCNFIEICKEYEYSGESYNLGNKVIEKGDRFKTAPLDTEVLKHCNPIYETFKGWNSDISNVKNYGNLPLELKKIIRYIEKEAKVEAVVISVGPERNQTIIR